MDNRWIEEEGYKWTEKEMQLALFEWLEMRKRTLIMPNFTPRRWQECDMFSLTAALYYHEIEVKVSRGDFRADFRDKRYKHMTLAETFPSRSLKSPPRTFMYACPAGLLSVADMPEYAGLIHVRRYIRDYCATRYEVRIEKKAPVIRGAEKLSSEQVFQISSHLWYRYANEWKKGVRLRVKREV